MSLSKARLDLLSRVAERNEEEALTALRGAETRLAEQTALHGELGRYLDDYQQRPIASPNPMLLENQRQFIAKLDEALQSQAKAVEAAKGRVAQAREAWMGTRRELRISLLLQEQGAAEDRRIDDRRSQRETDEFALNRHIAAGARYS
ncbi:flagellar export protein FliJ [Nevskia sp.]|uniref:flagellar export protein FliJ n=1 Tax=Nevskia sp. TaxID=1929292 RepID=UPI0025E2A4B5|nr:flagellar export protein FliJ [Nevskia sp.]